MSKRYDHPIEVEEASRGSRALEKPPPGQSCLRPPVAFSWRGKRYPVDRLLKHWVEAGEGWDPDRKRDEEFFRVEADGGTYELLFDRLSEHPDGEPGSQPRWRLARVWD